MGTWDERMTPRPKAAPRWNTFTTVCPVQFVGESAVKGLPLRLACSAMRVGDPVQVTEGGRIVTGTRAVPESGLSGDRLNRRADGSGPRGRGSPGARGEGAGVLNYPPRTVRTGQGAVATTRPATLPKNSFVRPERPCVPMTTRSARFVFARRPIAREHRFGEHAVERTRLYASPQGRLFDRLRPVNARMSTYTI